LEFAERMAYTGKRVTDRFFKRLQKEFTDEELVDFLRSSLMKTSAANSTLYLALRPMGYAIC